MTVSQIKQAEENGCTTARELSLWYMGYLTGEKETLIKAIDDLSNEDRMAKKENDEHYADYSDRNDDMYDAIKEEFKGKDDD